MPYFETNNAKIYYNIYGEGIPIMFIHGISLDSRMWGPQIDYFKKFYKVICYDLRFYGRSTEATSYYHSEDLNNILNFLNIEKAHLVGLSRGGRVSIDFNIEYPGRTLSMTLANSSLSGTKYPSEVKERQKILEKLANENIKKAREYWLLEPIFNAALNNSQLALKLKEIIDDYSGIHWIEGFQKLELWKIDKAEDYLPSLDIPSLVISGGKDAEYFKEISRKIHDLLPNNQQVVFMESGHMVNMEEPDKFNLTLHNFLKTIKN